MYGFKFLINRMRRDHMRRSYTHIVCPQLRKIQFTQIRSYSRRIVNRQLDVAAKDVAAVDDNSNWPRKIFSGIQPTGSLHLGNYLGAVRKWTELQDANEDVTFCIVDMHSITLPQESAVLRENIFKLAATMLACGINPNKSTIFVQSAVKEHTELCWMLGTLCTMARLGHLPQYKDKTQQLREIPLGLFVYPILQAADIMLYKTTHVPVGEDQVQHIQLTQHLARVFNTRFGSTFPICHAIIDDKKVSRIRSLRDPTKKMSKSDTDPKSAIYVTDEPDVVVEKVKKAVTDFCSDVSYDAEGRPGVSNLIAIHSYIIGQSIEQIINEARTLDTGKYKLRVAEAINEHLKPIREKIKDHLDNRTELVNILDVGAEKARNIAFDTVEEVKHRMGLGAPYLPLYIDTNKSVSETVPEPEPKPDVGQACTASATATFGTAYTAPAQQIRTHILETKMATLEVSRKLSAALKPSVPQQRLRVEKQMEKRRTLATGKPINIVDDITKGLLHKGLLRRAGAKKNDENDKTSGDLTEPKIRRIARCVEVKPPATIVAPAASSSQAIECDMSNQRNKIVGNVLIAGAAATTTNTNAATNAATTTTTTTATTNLPSTSASLSIAKTTLPVAWHGASSKTSDSEQTKHNNNMTATKKSTPTTTTTATASMTPTTFKRHFTTSSTIHASQPESARKNPPPKGHSNQKIVQNTVVFGILAIGAGFGGVYYFWRSILSAYFESKKNGGG